MKILFLLALLSLPLFAETNCPATMTPAECSALKALHPQEVKLPNGCGVSHPAPYTEADVKNCESVGTAYVNPELDTANKKIADLEKQLKNANAQMNLFRGDHIACHDQLVASVAIVQQLQEEAKSK